jgi:hypothetical protein
MQLKKIIALFILISLCLSSQATFIPLTVQEIDGSPSVSKVKNITFNGATLTDLLNGRVLVTVAPGSTAAGSSGNIQFNNSGAFASSSNLSWNNGTNTLLVNGAVNANYFRTPNKTAATSLLAYRIYDEYGFAHGLGLDANNQLYTSSSLGINGSPPGGHRFSVNGLTSIRLGTADYFGVGDANDGFAAFKIIPTSNYVGIGTQNPSERLEVLGNAKINGKLTANGTNASAVVLTAKGASGQTANLQEWKKNTGTVLASVSAGGNLTANGSINFTSPSSGISFPGFGSVNTTDWASIDGGLNRYFLTIGTNNRWLTFQGNGVMVYDGLMTIDATSIRSQFDSLSPRLKWNINKLSIINNSGSEFRDLEVRNVISNGDVAARSLHISQTMKLAPISGSQPASPALGDIYVDGDTGTFCGFDGSVWAPLGGGTNTCN